MLKPTFGNVPKIQESIDNLIAQLELYRAYLSDCMEYDLATAGYKIDEANDRIREHEEDEEEITAFIDKLKSMSVSHD